MESVVLRNILLLGNGRYMHRIIYLSSKLS